MKSYEESCTKDEKFERKVGQWTKS
jgi:hypothetical protein